MKQGRFIWKIIYALFAVFIVVYIIGTVWNTLYNPIKTVSAVYTTVENSIETEGFVIREERVIEAAYSGVAEMQLAEGERAAKGDAVAYIFANEAEVDKVHKRKELQERIDRLQILMNQGNKVVDLKSVDAAIIKLSQEMCGYYEAGDFERISNSIDELKNKTLSREYVYHDKSDLEGVIAELKAEQKAIGKASVQKVVYAPIAGYYSGESDGYENELSCKKINELTPTKFAELSETIAVDSQNDGTLGKIISEFYWYYAFVVDEQQAAQFKDGKTVDITFDGPTYPRVKAIVNSKSEVQDGKVCVVLRADEHIGDFTLARKLKANVISSVYEGLKVPREALRMNEKGVQGVYCLIDSQAKFKPVETIFEKDSYYIVRYDSSDTKSLLLYDEIIVSAKELEHRKMVK